MIRVFAVSYDRFSAFRRILNRTPWTVQDVSRDSSAQIAYVTVGR